MHHCPSQVTEANPTLLPRLTIRRPAAQIHADILVDSPALAWRQMEAIKRAGLARSIGVSSFTTAALEEILSICEVRGRTIPCKTARVHNDDRAPRLSLKHLSH